MSDEAFPAGRQTQRRTRPESWNTSMACGGRYFTRRRSGRSTSRPFTMSRAQSTCARMLHRQAKRTATSSGAYSIAIDTLTSSAGHAANTKPAMLAIDSAATAAASPPEQWRIGSNAVHLLPRGCVVDPDEPLARQQRGHLVTAPGRHLAAVHVLLPSQREQSLAVRAGLASREQSRAGQLGHGFVECPERLFTGLAGQGRVQAIREVCRGILVLLERPFDASSGFKAKFDR